MLASIQRNCIAQWQYGRSAQVTIAVTLKKLLIDDTGATAIEYALIAAAMGACLVPALSATTDGVGIVYTRIKDLFSSPVVAL